MRVCSNSPHRAGQHLRQILKHLRVLCMVYNRPLDGHLPWAKTDITLMTLMRDKMVCQRPYSHGSMLQKEGEQRRTCFFMPFRSSTQRKKGPWGISNELRLKFFTLPTPEASTHSLQMSIADEQRATQKRTPGSSNELRLKFCTFPTPEASTHSVQMSIQFSWPPISYHTCQMCPAIKTRESALQQDCEL